MSDRDDAASTTSTIIHPLSVDTADMTPQQLCNLGEIVFLSVDTFILKQQPYVILKR